MNNKQLGTAFEREMCEILANNGWWAHFIVPDERGAQPFDIIAAKNGRTIAADCKTCDAKTFGISRLEDNQVTSFELWKMRGNSEPLVFVKHDDVIYVIRYVDIRNKNVRICEQLLLEIWLKSEE